MYRMMVQFAPAATAFGRPSTSRTSLVKLKKTAKHNEMPKPKNFRTGPTGEKSPPFH